MPRNLSFVLTACLGALICVAPGSAQNVRADGPPVRLLSPDVEAAAPRWSPEGNQLAFTSPDYTGLWVVSRDGGVPTQLSDALSVGFGATWSPNGEAILSRASRYDEPTRLHSIVVFDVNRNTSTMLADEAPTTTSVPEWIDDQHVAFDRGDQLEVVALASDAPSVGIASKVMATSSGRLGLARLASGTIETISSLPSDARVINVTPSPDGSLVAFEIVGGGLHVMNSDGSGLTDLGLASRPSWSPDSAWLVAMQTEDDGHRITSSDLVACRPDGSMRVYLTQTPDRLEMNPSWSPDGRLIAFDDLTDGALYILPVSH